MNFTFRRSQRLLIALLTLVGVFLFWSGTAIQTLAQATNTPTSTPSTTIWVDDTLPAGSIAATENGDVWNWIPASNTGSLSHQSAVITGTHQHYFYAATDKLTINSGDVLMVWVYLDPANPPTEIMLQWHGTSGSFTSSSWEHRAYWGANWLNFGVDGTNSRRYMGALPASGQWV